MAEEQGQAADKSELTLERYAEVKAHTLHFPRAAKPEVLARLGVEPDEWERADTQWMRAIKAESRRKEAPTSRAFAMAFAETQKRLEEENPPLEAIGELPAPAVTEPTPKADEQAPPLAPKEPLPAIVASVPVAPPELAAKPDTASPWVQGLVAMAAPSTPAPVPEPAEIVPVGMRHFQSLQGTELASPIPAGPALPFDAKTASPRDALDNAIAHAREVQRPAVAAQSKLGETSYVPSPQAAGPALPFENQKPPADSDIPGFSLEQYASLTVELELRPAQTDETLRRYGLSVEQRAKLDAYWQKRMSDNSSVWLAWDRARNAYRAWLLSQPAWQRGTG